MEKPGLDVEGIAEEAQLEELSSGMEPQVKGMDIERPSISIPGSAIKPAAAENISIGHVSLPALEIPATEQKAEEEKYAPAEERKRRSYLADVRDAIKRSQQKARERSRKRTELRTGSVERARAESAKRSSLSGAATVGLFTPLQLVSKFHVSDLVGERKGVDPGTGRDVGEGYGQHNK